MSITLVDLKKIIDDYMDSKLEEVSYNVFDVLSVSDKEVIMCRMLADLLNPKGKHKNGTKYLESFLQIVLKNKYEFTEELLKKTEVIKELKIPESDRRIDIVVKNKKWFMPIEVKINAEEQESQCFDYSKYAKDEFKNKKIVYLTKYGTYPSPYSTGGAKEGPGTLEKIDIITISFSEDIVNWLQKIVRDETGELRYSLNQYLNSIKEFTHTMDKKLYENLANELFQSKENLTYGLQIAEAVAFAKADVLKNVLTKIEKAIDVRISKNEVLKRYHLEKESKFDWYSFEHKANAEFYKVNSTFPGINYVVKNVKLPDGLELWFRVEVEHNLFAGFCVFDPKANKGHGDEKIIDEELKEKLKVLFTDDKCETGKWWANWRYLPNGDSSLVECVPNFKEMNEAAIELADTSKLEEFAEGCIKVIEKDILPLLKTNQE